MRNEKTIRFWNYNASYHILNVHYTDGRQSHFNNVMPKRMRAVFDIRRLLNDTEKEHEELAKIVAEYSALAAARKVETTEKNGDNRDIIEELHDARFWELDNKRRCASLDDTERDEWRKLRNRTTF